MQILIVDAVEWGGEHENLACPVGVSDWIRQAFGGDPARFQSWRVQREENPPSKKFDGVVITGSSASAYDALPWIERLSRAILDWADHGVPILGICFGHQILAQALGGRVEKNPAGWEVGTCEVELTEAGRNDYLFKGFPNRFPVMQSHQDVVTQLPPGAECLAANAICGIQAMRVGDKIRSVQFHPEYTKEHIEFLLRPRRERLTRAGVNMDAVFAGIAPTPRNTIILSNFERTLILGENGRS